MALYTVIGPQSISSVIFSFSMFCLIPSAFPCSSSVIYSILTSFSSGGSSSPVYIYDGQKFNQASDLQFKTTP